MRKFKLHYSEVSDKEMHGWSKGRLIHELRWTDESLKTACERAEKHRVEVLRLRMENQELLRELKDWEEYETRHA